MSQEGRAMPRAHLFRIRPVFSLPSAPTLLSASVTRPIRKHFQLCTTPAIASGSVFCRCCLRIQEAGALHRCGSLARLGPPGSADDCERCSSEEEAISLSRAPALGLNLSNRIWKCASFQKGCEAGHFCSLSILKLVVSRTACTEQASVQGWGCRCEQRRRDTGL